MAAWRDIAALRDPDRFEAWLRRLLVHACYREARKERARRLVEVHVPVFDQERARRALATSPTATSWSGASAA